MKTIIHFKDGSVQEEDGLHPTFFVEDGTVSLEDHECCILHDFDMRDISRIVVELD